MRKRERKQHGGVVNRVPKPSTLTPIPITTAADLQKYFKFYSLIGHGAQPSVKDNTVFLVPERTWILFVARAGEPTPKIKPTIDPILEDFRNLRSAGSQSPHCKPEAAPRAAEETEAEWHQRALECMESGELFKPLLYTAANPKNFSKMSIYQPGDLVQNIVLQFYNEHPPWDPVGVWELPLKKETVADGLEKGRRRYSERVEEFLRENIPKLAALGNEIKGEDKSKFDTVLDFFARQFSMSYEEVQAIQDTLNDNLLELVAKYPKFNLKLNEFNKQFGVIGEILKRDQQIFDSMPKNKLAFLKDKVKATRTTSLYDLLTNEVQIDAVRLKNATKSQPVYEPSYRFFIIDICRKTMDIMPAPKRLTRSLSLSGRQLLNNSGAVCYQSILSLDKNGFQALLTSKGSDATLQTLLTGAEVPLDAFQEVYTGTKFHPQILNTMLNDLLTYHKFKKGDTVLLYNLDDPKIPIPVIIDAYNSQKQEYMVRDLMTGIMLGSISAYALWEDQEKISEFSSRLANNLTYIKDLQKKAETSKELQARAEKAKENYLAEEKAKSNALVAARMKEHEEQSKLVAAARATEKEKFVADKAKLQDKISALSPAEQSKIVYGKKYWIKDSPDAPDYKERYGAVVGIGFSASKNQLLIALDIVTMGGEPALKRKAFPLSVLMEGKRPANQGGGSKTRHQKKSKKRKTRRI
jgi:hypothetical protein